MDSNDIREIAIASSPREVSEFLKKMIGEENNQILCRDAYYAAINWVTDKTSQQCIESIDNLPKPEWLTFCEMVNDFISALSAISDESDSKM